MTLYKPLHAVYIKFWNKMLINVTKMLCFLEISLLFSSEIILKQLFASGFGECIYLIRHFVMQHRWVFLRVVPYFDEPVGRVKIQITSKNTQRYYTTKRLISYLLSNTPNCYFSAGEFRGYLFTGSAWQKYAKRNGIGALLCCCFYFLH